MSASIESIEWHSIAESLPDDDRTVLLFDARNNVRAWPGYHDGDCWRYVEAIEAQPTHWAEMPEGPKP